MDEQLVKGINLALDESQLLGLEFHERPVPRVAATFRCLQLDEKMEVPDDRRIGLTFMPISELYISLRNGFWNDQTADAQPVDPMKLTELIESFGTVFMYNEESIDSRKSHFAQWKDRISYRFVGSSGAHHVCELYQEHPAIRILDIRFAFSELEIYYPADMTLERCIDLRKRFRANSHDSQGEPTELGRSFGYISMKEALDRFK
jgi:hypothetical protein